MKPLTLARKVAVLLAFVASAPLASHGADADGRRFASNHQGVFGGQKLRYSAIVEERFITDAAGKRTASIFTTSYIRSDVPKGAQRPVMFVFNGGPGSASIWLHMGYVGPRRIDFKDVVKPETVPPFNTVDNPDSPLDAADIVLIDPVGTGFSRILPDGKPEQFYGTAQDAKVTVELIQRWTRENDRWNAPKYLLSESYGTIRAAVVARLLAGGPMETGSMEGTTLNGVILLGQAMDMGGSAGDDGRYINTLPTLAATACYHGKVTGCSAAGQVDAANKFINEEYLQALHAGSRLTDAQRDSVVNRLAALIGLSPAVVRENNLRLNASAFARSLLADQGKELGMYDGRYTLPLAASGKDPVADDPAMGQYVPGFVAAYNLYARKDLGVSIADEYQPIAFRAVNGPWDYGRGPGGGADKNFATDLAVAMRRNPQLRLMVGTGYYDLVTTLGAADYTVAHAGIPLDATQLYLYPSGHMPYLGTEAREALAKDVRAFIAGAKK
ncbi:S10 family peptidase [Peristeroidobacter soli]|uniref:S10 family peptidase n=1 Tax=Peristeroidobacter soli TaxID=2497877 RepID=UPI00101DBBDF|nr:peptidase S10 [Peristeroidobacter soli]